MAADARSRWRRQRRHGSRRWYRRLVHVRQLLFVAFRFAFKRVGMLLLTALVHPSSGKHALHAEGCSESSPKVPR